MAQASAAARLREGSLAHGLASVDCVVEKLDMRTQSETARLWRLPQGPCEPRLWAYLHPSFSSSFLLDSQQ